MTRNIFLILLLVLGLVPLLVAREWGASLAWSALIGSFLAFRRIGAWLVNG